MVDSLQPHGLCSSWNSPGQNTGLGSLSLLQGIFPTQGSNPGLSHCRQTLCQLNHKRSPIILNYVIVHPKLNKIHLLTILQKAGYSSVGKESACNAGDPSSIPGSGRSAGEGIGYPLQYSWASLVAQWVKTWVRSLGWEDPLEKGKATYSSILAWRIPWTV